MTYHSAWKQPDHFRRVAGEGLYLEPITRTRCATGTVWPSSRKPVRRFSLTKQRFHTIRGRADDLPWREWRLAGDWVAEPARDVHLRSRMVKKTMRRGSSGSRGRRGAAGVEPSIRTLPAPYLSKGTVGHYLCPDDYVPSEPSPNRISLERHSCLTDRTQRSVNAFRFGLRGGSARHFTFPVANMARNEAQIVSRSCNRYRCGRR